MTKTVSGLFDDYDDALTATNKLQMLDISREDISLVANNSDERYGRHDGTTATTADGSEVAADAAGGAGIGAVLGGGAGVLAGLGLLAIPGIGPVVAAGWLASTALGAAAGAVAGGAAGGIVGAMTNDGVPEKEAHVYAEGVRRGGTLVSARVPDDRVMEAQAILDEHRRVDWSARERDYRADGWNSFDESAPVYSADEVARERGRYPR